MAKIFSIMDVKAQFFMKPFSEDHTAQAIRAFEIGSNDPKSTFNRFPDDFALFEIGEFNSETGEFTPTPAPLNLCTARNLLKEVPNAQT